LNLARWDGRPRASRRIARRAAEHIAVAIELALIAQNRIASGTHHLANRQPDAARKRAPHAITLNPRDERSRLALADALIVSGDLPAAERHCRTCSRCFPRLAARDTRSAWSTSVKVCMPMRFAS
jgi:Tfp pilus assembly protein PilF